MERGQISVATMCIIAVVTPATIGLSLYRITGDEGFRPLAIYADELGDARANGTGDTAIQVVMQIPATPQGHEAAQSLGLAIKKSFRARGYPSRITIRPDPALVSPTVTFAVGHNTFGPFTPGTAVDAVGPAIAAINAFAAREDE